MAIASMPTSNEQTTNFLLILWFWNENVKRVDVNHRQKILTDKSEWTSSCLEILPPGVPLQLMFLVWKWSRMNLMVLEKLLPLELFIGRFCMFLKLRCVQIARGFKLHMTYANFTCICTQINNNRILAFAILLWRYSRSFLVYIIYSALSMPFYF